MDGGRGIAFAPWFTIHHALGTSFAPVLFPFRARHDIRHPQAHPRHH